jgi:hypothetical protein
MQDRFLPFHYFKTYGIFAQMKYAYIVLAIFIYAGESAAQLPFDSVIVRIKNYPCHYHRSETNTEGVTTKTESDMIHATTVNFVFDSTNVSGDTVICFNKKNIKWQYLRIIYDTITSTIKHFNFVQRYEYGVNPTRLNYAFNNFPIVATKDSMSGFLYGSDILESSLTASDTSSYFVYIGGKVATWQYGYRYLGTTTDSTSLSFRMLPAYRPPLAVKREHTSQPMFWPNPAKDRIFFSALSVNKGVRIYDLLGRLVLRSLATPEIDLSKMPKGIYRIEISGKVQNLIIN